MEAQNKEITKSENKRKLSFGDLKIRNKIIFGFFIVSIISGLANYYSNSFIVNEFRSVNNTMHIFHDIFAKQKKLELMVENYVASESIESASDSDFRNLHKEIETQFSEFMRTGGSFLEKELVERFVDESGKYFEKEYDVVVVHKREIEERNLLMQLQAQEKEKRYGIREYINNLADGDIQTAFLYAEYLGKEMLYQYKDSEHAKEWLEALDKVKEVTAARTIEIPGFDDYYDIASRTSEAAAAVELTNQEEQRKIEGFRFAIEDLNAIQDEVSKAIINQNLKEIDAIVIAGVFVFIFILMFFTIMFGYVLSTFISGPIKKLADFALMAGKGNFRRRMNIYTTDEIGLTAKAFNLLLDKVEESTEVLEVKVNARTKRLEELSHGLEVQIGDKTKELNEKIRELERFNDLAVGRELRMVELKQEIEIMKQSAGEDKVQRNDKKSKGPKSKAKNCWDFWDCKKEIREKCSAYLSNSGRECWIVSAGKCPRSKVRGFEDCRECAWYKKMNKKIN